MPYRVTFKADYVEKRSRLTTFFRLLLAIPHIIFLYFYGLAAGVLVIVAWFALLFTGRYPQGMYDFVARLAALLDAGLRLPVAAHRRVPAVLGRAPRPLIRSTSTSPRPRASTAG